MFKRIIFIGQSGNDAVYFDSVTGQFYKKAKSRFFDMGRGKNGPVISLVIVGVINLFAGSVSGRPFGAYVNNLPGWFSYVYVLGMMLTVSIALTLYTSRTVYGDLSNLRDASHEEVSAALDSNRVIRNSLFETSKVTWYKYAYHGVVIGGVFLANVGLLVLFCLDFFSAVFSAETISPLEGSFLTWTGMGILPFVLILFVWLNNPFRVMRVAKRFRRGDYKFPDESVKRA